MRALAVIVLAVLAILVLLRLPATPVVPPAPVVTFDPEQVTLGVVEAAGRQEFARQRIQLRYGGYVTASGPLGALGVRTEYQVIVTAPVKAIIDLTPPASPAITRQADGTIALGLPAPELVPELTPDTVEIFVGADYCPDVVCGSYDRLSVLADVAPQAEADLVARAAESGLGERAAAEAQQFYASLLSRAGVRAVVTVEGGAP